MITDCRGKDYEKRLECVKLWECANLTTCKLEMRRERVDMLEVYKIIKCGMEGLGNNFFKDLKGTRSILLNWQ